MSTHSARLFRLLSTSDLVALRDPRWLIRDVLPANALGVLYGEPGCGKTFVALSMGLSIAAGHNWCGKRTVPGLVLYVAAEGLTGFKLRVPAYLKKHALKGERIYFSGDSFDLRNTESIEAILGVLETADFRPDLIVLDTLARLMPGADENSAKEMGEAIASIDALRRQTSATVLVVHHSSKAGKSERGSSALRGAADVMIECSRKKDTGLVSLVCTKMKDAEEFERATVGLERIALCPSSSSLAVTDWKDTVEAGTGQGGTEAALIALRAFGPNGATNKDWQKAYIAKTAASQSSFDRALRKLKQDQAVRHDGNKYFPVKDEELSVSGRCQAVS